MDLHAGEKSASEVRAGEERASQGYTSAGQIGKRMPEANLPMNKLLMEYIRAEILPRKVQGTVR